MFLHLCVILFIGGRRSSQPPPRRQTWETVGPTTPPPTVDPPGCRPPPIGRPPWMQTHCADHLGRPPPPECRSNPGRQPWMQTPIPLDADTPSLSSTSTTGLDASYWNAFSSFIVFQKNSDCWGYFEFSHLDHRGGSRIFVGEGANH